MAATSRAKAVGAAAGFGFGVEILSMGRKERVCGRLCGEVEIRLIFILKRTREKFMRQQNSEKKRLTDLKQTGESEKIFGREGRAPQQADSFQ